MRVFRWNKKTDSISEIQASALVQKEVWQFKWCWSKDMKWDRKATEHAKLMVKHVHGYSPGNRAGFHRDTVNAVVSWPQRRQRFNDVSTKSGKMGSTRLSQESPIIEKSWSYVVQIDPPKMHPNNVADTSEKSKKNQNSPTAAMFKQSTMLNLLNNCVFGAGFWWMSFMELKMRFQRSKHPWRSPLLKQSLWLRWLFGSQQSE